MDDYQRRVLGKFMRPLSTANLFGIVPKPSRKYAYPFQKSPVPLPFPVFFTRVGEALPVMQSLLPPTPTLNSKKPNSTKYFTLYPNKEELPPHEVRQLILNPDVMTSDDLGLEYVAGTKHSEVLPFHVPDLCDVESICPVLGVYMKWWMGEQTEEESAILPESLQFMCDPSPMLPQIRSLFELAKPVELRIMSYTNAFYLFETAKPFTNLQVTGMSTLEGRQSVLQLNPIVHDPRSTDGPRLGSMNVCPIVEGTTIVVWNGRGLCREEFCECLKHINSTHLPDILIITESRVTRKRWVQLLSDLPFQLPLKAFEVAEPRGLTGGMVILWRRLAFTFTSVTTDVHAINGTFMNNGPLY